MTPTLPDIFTQRPLAHRALHDAAQGRIQNSLSAVQAAINHGYGIEIDLQLSADQDAMVFHDDDLDALAHGSGPVYTHSTEALGEMRLRGGRDGIDTLAAILTTVAGKTPLLIELKEQHDPTRNRALAAATCKALEDYAGPVALMSFSPVLVGHVQRFAPHLPRGLVSYNYHADPDSALPDMLKTHLTQMRDFDALGCSFTSYQWQDLDCAPIHALKSRGVPILCWTTKSPQDDAAARAIADNVTFEQYLPPLS